MAAEALVHVRLNVRDQAFLDEMVEKGNSSSKSDVLHTALRLYQYSELCGQLRQANPKPRPLKTILAELKQIRQTNYKRVFGAGKC